MHESDIIWLSFIIKKEANLIWDGTCATDVFFEAMRHVFDIRGNFYGPVVSEILKELMSLELNTMKLKQIQFKVLSTLTYPVCRHLYPLLSGQQLYRFWKYCNNYRQIAEYVTLDKHKWDWLRSRESPHFPGNLISELIENNIFEMYG